MSPRARVFISCGQSKRDNELAVSQAIAARLKKLGFEPYIAVAEQTLKGVKENIFRQLESSEYFLFIDFKRERLPDKDGKDGQHRGSLFSHQELAIASFREKEVIGFQEQGVELNGVARYVQANFSSFSERDQLPGMVEDHARRGRWDPNWRRELTMQDLTPSTSDIKRLERDFRNNVHNFPARFFHIHVTNRHRDKPAINCYAYLEAIVDAETDQELPLRTVEHKWEGYTFPNAIIGPQSSRAFDAFWVRKKATVALASTTSAPAGVASATRSLEFNVFADATYLSPKVKAPGDYVFTYRVIAENFPSTSASFNVSVRLPLEETTLQPA